MNKTRLYLLLLLVMLLLPSTLTGCTRSRQETDTGQTTAGEAAAAPAGTGSGEETRKDSGERETQNTEEQLPPPAGEQGDEEGAGEEPVLFGTISCRLPEDFVQYENNPGIFVCKDYPKDIACISYIIADYDGKEPETGETELLDSIQESLKEDYGEEAEAEITSLDTFRIGGHRAVEIRLSCRLLGTSYDMFQLMIFDSTGGQEHIFNFMQEKDGKWTRAFQESMASVTFR